jgi:hypothetical protein
MLSGALLVHDQSGELEMAMRTPRWRTGRLLAAALASVFTSSARSEPIYARSIGPNSCGDWQQHSQVGQGDVSVPLTPENLANAMMLNWVLAFLSGYASAPGRPNLLNGVEPATVATWLDYYCSDHPSDGMSKAASQLRDELLRRPALRPGP